MRLGAHAIAVVVVAQQQFDPRGQALKKSKKRRPSGRAACNIWRVRERTGDAAWYHSIRTTKKTEGP